MSISIILPVYNAEKFLDKAIKSILIQTHKQFELICIDDGSTDQSLNILKKYATLDDRVIVISRENKGLIYTLNQAIDMSKYNYIARMDADDVCLSTRLEAQLKLMRKERLAIVGSSYTYIDIAGNIIGSRSLPSSNSVISWLMDLGSPLCHPSVMFDKTLLGKELYYNADFKHCEDYELWFRCRSIGVKFGNLKEKLFNYRVLDTSVSRQNRQEQKQTSINLVTRYCSYAHNKTEAEYLLFDRNTKRNTKLNLKFFFRIFKKLSFAKAIFVFLYLTK
ncbi:hypothetical protein PTE01_35130 [Pseudoalteromonas tetraodonis GFC]|uniref:Glycosyltransferase 2-like domain-containing protein n=1 Tax=Pseudoalteromonas tetraodonis GFC TaxID=1315271 RepID=A0AA37RZF2_9GAMM|nr:glycosyltransferase [Pseudoalteromonas tetraodonis]ATD02062.1 hypothetical protein PTET_a0502 [Pseudoalteromonas tetraodonis]GEN40403.1 hypothetical protein PTE01_35130 [Pseudoalteromonas tetraodonis GFC]GLQ01137.1 hypothetical protein GCM10007914_00180 [Pseudoalteromonas tetraodonis GFC]